MRLLPPLAALAVAACGNPPPATATFVGTVPGEAMPTADSISNPATVTFTSGVTPVGAIVVSDAGSLCTRVSANRDPRDARVLSVYLSDVNGQTGTIGPPAGTGTWPVFIVGSGSPPAHFASAAFAVNDSVCKRVAGKSASAVSGEVVLSRNVDGVYAGTYDLVFDSGDHVTGSFDSAPCRGLAAYLAANTHLCG